MRTRQATPESSFLFLAPLLLCASLAAACSSSHDASDVGVQDVLSGVMANGSGTVTVHAGGLPSAGSGAAPTVTGATTVINGGTAQVTVTADQAFTHVIIGVRGADGYFEVTLPTAQVTVELLLTMAQELDESEIELTYAVGNGGSVGAYEDAAATVTSVGTGDLQVSISWDVDSDVDLHVVDPSGEDIYYGSRTGPSGGFLDLDSNPACAIDGIRNENITWDTAASGTYKVRVDYYDACAVAATDYVVTVQRAGQAAQTFMGRLTGEGDQGGEGDGIDVTTFTVP